MSAEPLEKRVERLESRMQVVEERIKTKYRRRFGMTLEEVKAYMDNPPKLTPEQIEKAKEIVGIWDGPEDLSEHLRDYLRGDKR
jgi:hypothetical protein